MVPRQSSSELSELAECAAFRNELRAAREACARDAEAFDGVLFTVERLGCRLLGRMESLFAYRECLSQLARKSTLVAEAGDANGLLHFPSLFDSIREARNAALHQGAVARNLTSHVIELALILEDALGNELQQVRYLMVKNPVIAERWQTLAAIRQLMLANAFSYLPIHWSGKWCFISDHVLASYLRKSNRKAEMAKLLIEVLENKDLAPVEAPTCFPEDAADEVVQRMHFGMPVLVLNQDKIHLEGLISPADVL